MNDESLLIFLIFPGDFVTMNLSCGFSGSKKVVVVFALSMTETEQVQLRTLSDSILLQKTDSLVREERRIGIQILHHVKEISRRRLHCELGFSSVFTYLVEHLKYPEASAYRIVNAMKLLKELPEMEKKVEEGLLSIQTLSQVQSYCQAQKKENQLEIQREEKLQVLASVEGCSRKETEKVLASLYPAQPLSTPDRERRVSSHQTEVRIVLDDKLLEKLERVKQLISHQNLNPTYAELIDYLAEVTLNQLDPVRKAEKIQNRKQEKQKHDKQKLESQQRERQTSSVGKQTPFPGKLDSSAHPVTPPTKDQTGDSSNLVQKRSRTIAAADRRQVWKEAGAQCAFISPLTGRRCEEKKGLQIHHKQAFARGGCNDASNLALYCHHHNLHEAIRDYSMERMRPFLNL